MPFGYIVYMFLEILWRFKLRSYAYIKKDTEGWQRVYWDSYWGYDSGGHPNYYSSYYNNVFDFLLDKDLQKPYR